MWHVYWLAYSLGRGCAQQFLAQVLRSVLQGVRNRIRSCLPQGVSAELAPRLSLALAAGAARYGHVMHPEVAIEPALAVARRLLDGPGRGWAARVFFSDDGSTAVEVALKMAFRKFLANHADVAAALGAAGAPELQVDLGDSKI